MAAPVVNVLLTSFPGLGIPSTLCLPISASTSISKLSDKLSDYLPAGLTQRLLLTTNSGKRVDSASHASISTLLSSCLCARSDILQLRLSAPICGGKGGFGSQLRAAGGRMSSRKKRAQGDSNGSNRNLDGRRLRTVTEAKALAEYLAIKPEMDKKEKEERRKRWEQVVDSAQARQEEIKNGSGKAKVDAKWLEAKEEIESKTREAITAAMKEGLLRDNAAKILEDKKDHDEDSELESEDGVESGESSSSKATTPPSAHGAAEEVPRKVWGWDDEDEDEGMSDSDEGEEEDKDKDKD